MERNLETAVRRHHIVPAAPDPQIDLGDRDLAPVAAPPALDELRGCVGLVDQVFGGVEVPRDQDLRIRREGHHC
jgi:hypothetical protein